MSLFKRRYLLVAMLSLTACGFEPVYGPGSSANKLRNNIDVIVKKGRFDFEYRNRLQERLGSVDSSSKYLLNYNIIVTSEDVVISDADNIERYTLEGVVNFDVIDRDSKAVLHSGKALSNTAYSVTASTYPTSIAERDANVRLVLDLADKTVTLLSISAKEWLK